MDRMLKRIGHVLLACAILVLVSGCNNNNKERDPDPGGNGNTGGEPPGEGPGESDGEEDFIFVYGAAVTQEDLPLPLADDPGMSAPTPLPDETPTPSQLGIITSPWPAKSQSEILNLLEREANSQPTSSQRATMAQLGLIDDPETP